MDIDFPIEANPSRLLSIIEIIKEKDGSEYLSGLAESTKEQIDELLPLIDAITILGFGSVKDGVVKLSAKGSEISTKNFHHMIREAIDKIEPFHSIIKVIGNDDLTTADIAKALDKEGIRLHEDEEANQELLRNLMLRWGSAVKLFEYVSENDSWKLENNLNG